MSGYITPISPYVFTLQKLSNCNTAIQEIKPIESVEYVTI